MREIRNQPKLSELLRLESRFSATEWLEIETLARPLVLFQELPDIAIICQSGLYLPPHQRSMMHAAHTGSQEFIVVGSRGTSKSSTFGVIYSAYMNTNFAMRNLVTISATGFRGGQLIFNDIERLMDGGFSSQQAIPPFLRAGVATKPNPVKRAQNYWSIQYDSKSENLTIPTKDPDAMRGIRAKDLMIDEANTADKSMVERVAGPFLNVMGDMRHGGAYAEANRMFQMSTVDFSWRPFYEQYKAALEAMRIDWLAAEAKREGDRARYLALDGQHTLGSTTVLKFDYVDTMIRRELTTREGKRYQVNFTDTEIPLTTDTRGIPYLDRDAEGKLLVEGKPVQYWKTYAIDKAKLEQGLRNGTSDTAAWKAEQRNIVDTAAGDVYSHDLVDAASCVGERFIIPYKKLPETWQTKYVSDQRDYEPGVQWTCADPCVLGVDYAWSSDFCAFVVIRLGPMGKGTFDPFTHEGKTTWSNVVWCEQHQRMTHKEVADRIREFRLRYNLYYVHDTWVTDKSLNCRAVCIDMRGGGNGVRDELALFNGEYTYTDPIYDPDDKDDRVRAFQLNDKAVPMLDAFSATGPWNERLVEYTRAQMEQGLLYLPKYVPVDERPKGKRELHIAYEASRNLSVQLRKLQQEPTQNGRRFYMEGDLSQNENKKDLWAAFIYAGKLMRAHLLRQRTIDESPPAQAMRVMQVGSSRGRRDGRAAGSK
jgi:hypothetical protein